MEKKGAVQIQTETAIVYGQAADTGVYGAAAALNGIRARGAMNAAVTLRTEYPGGMEKTQIYEMEKRVRRVCQEMKTELRTVAREQNDLVACPMLIVTAAGETPLFHAAREERFRPGQEIILTKWVGLEGTLRLLDEKREELERRFSGGFLEELRSLKGEIFVGREIEVIREAGIRGICPVAGGGILAALWDLALESGCGLEADLRALAIRQETVELCEYFRLNPYQLAGTGSLLIAADNGEALAETLRKTRVPAAVIGRLTQGRDKILRNGEEIRYLDRPAPEEILKIFEKREK